MNKYEQIIKALNDGYTVYFQTSSRITVCTKKHIKMFSTDKNGHIYINKIDYTYCKITGER